MTPVSLSIRTALRIALFCVWQRGYSCKEVALAKNLCLRWCLGEFSQRECSYTEGSNKEVALYTPKIVMTSYFNGCFGIKCNVFTPKIVEIRWNWASFSYKK